MSGVAVGAPEVGEIEKTAMSFKSTQLLPLLAEKSNANMISIIHYGYSYLYDKEEHLFIIFSEKSTSATRHPNPFCWSSRVGFPTGAHWITKIP